MALAERLLEGTGGGSVIAVVSAPSVFVQLKNILVRFLAFNSGEKLGRQGARS